jgi:hypothetical protein
MICRKLNIPNSAKLTPEVWGRAPRKKVVFVVQISEYIILISQIVVIEKRLGRRSRKEYVESI